MQIIRVLRAAFKTGRWPESQDESKSSGRKQSPKVDMQTFLQKFINQLGRRNQAHKPCPDASKRYRHHPVRVITGPRSDQLAA
jgi:hypothetical protein